MRQSQAEIKAIEAELRSIRADSSVTLLDSTRPNPSDAVAAISPKIERRSSATSPATSPATSGSLTPATAKKRSIECFPLPAAHPSSSGPTQRRQAAHLPQQAITRQMLAEKAHQINRLSSQQEAVILELITLSEQLESANAVCEAAEVPHVDADAAGTLVLTSRAIELPPEPSHRRSRARNRSRYESRHQSQSQLMLASTGAVWSGGPLRALGRVGSFLVAPLGFLLGQPVQRKTRRASGRRATAKATSTEFTLQEAMVLVLGSAMLRVGLDLLVASYPALWIPSLVVMLTPAAIAIYRSTLMPQTGFVWGYRLFSLMIGLLLGGRL